MSIDHNADPIGLTNEFRRLADQSAPPYEVDLGQIVATGRRAKRRRRTTRTALTSLTAVVALCAVAAVAHTFTQPSQNAGSLGPAGVPTAASATHARGVEPGPSAVGKSAGATTTRVEFRFPVSVRESSASQVEAELREQGYPQLTTKTVTSSTVPQGNAVDILDAQNQSVLGKEVAVGTPLTVVVSNGSAR